MIELYYNNSTRTIKVNGKIVSDEEAKALVAENKFDCNMSMARLIRFDFDHRKLEEFYREYD